VCGTTTADGYAVIDIMPVPEHNPTGEPGGPFNSFDISLTDSVNHRFFVSDRLGLDVAVFDTQQDVAVNFFSGANGVAGGGANASSCAVDSTGTIFIPPIVTESGNWTRFGCRTLNFHIPTFGANDLFGGFPGAQCCAARANGVNPLSAPDGEALSPDNKTLFVGNGSASVVAFGPDQPSSRIFPLVFPLIMTVRMVFRPVSRPPTAGHFPMPAVQTCAQTRCRSEL
jgi:hypothetical protein